MATVDTTIFNLALAACGTRATVASVTEQSREAKLCAQFYDHVRQLVLSAAPWQEAKAFSRLALVATRDETLDWLTGDPQPGALYSYACPQDLIRPRHLTTYAFFDWGPRDTISFVITTNESDPILEYTFDQTNPNMWRIGLKDAIVSTLAAYICNPLTGSVAKQNQLLAYATEKVVDARAISGDSDNGQVLDWDPPWISARGSGLSGPTTQFIFPPADFGIGSFSLAK